MTYQLTIEPLGQTIDIEEGQTVLDACLRAGVWLPHACGHGLCGTCKVQTLEGELDHGEASPFALMDFEREEAKCLACCARPMSDMVIEADIEPDPDAQCLPLMDFTAEVVRIEALTPTIKGVFLRIEGEPLQFQPGQYVNVWIGKEATPRAFSIASPPSAGEIELNIRLVPGGSATTYVHEQLQVGDRLQLSGPLGRFFVRKSDPRPLVFMAGGSGLSSPRSMILDLLESGDPREIVLVQARAMPPSCTTATPSRHWHGSMTTSRTCRCCRASPSKATGPESVAMCTTSQAATSATTSAAGAPTCAGRRR